MLVPLFLAFRCFLTFASGFPDQSHQRQMSLPDVSPWKAGHVADNKIVPPRNSFANAAGRVDQRTKFWEITTIGEVYGANFTDVDFFLGCAPLWHFFSASLYASYAGKRQHSTGGHDIRAGPTSAQDSSASLLSTGGAVLLSSTSRIGPISTINCKLNGAAERQRPARSATDRRYERVQ